MTIPILNDNQVIEKLNQQHNPFFNEYYAFYSSWFGGIVTNPHLMVLPMDDHMVHRGDGVFEALKSVSRKVYLMDEHIQRLFQSAEAIAINPSVNAEQLKTIILETLRAANQNDVSIRIFISRGPGNFSANPYDSIKSQLYIAITRLTPPASSAYTNGVIIGKSNIPVKASWLAKVKSCNYLPNVLMKKESVDKHIDFVIGTDEHGSLTESATENVMIIDHNGILIHPPLDCILKGTTMIRACELARENGIATKVSTFTINDLLSAREAMITGTSLNILPVIKFESHPIGQGSPGPIARKLNELMLDDIENGTHSTAY